VTRTTGAHYEAHAERVLHESGLTTVARNFTCRVGELDLVMLDRGILVFVEVRFRRSARFGSAIETIGPTKQKRILRAAQVFLSRHRQFSDHPCRFDVVGLSGDPSSPALDWIAGAFSA
jgi:putative endonuclease